ncbi:MAG: hypothetical protein IVW52_12070 [Acidimicrobiales bacterium]|nr:hypothetical protein [Acidimicrobiales bacterium]
MGRGIGPIRHEAAGGVDPQRLVKGFVFRLIPPRPDFAFTMTDAERSTMLEHMAYWTRLAEEGQVLAFGPVNDPSGPYGIGIVLADDPGTAELIRDADPAMASSHGFRTEIAPMLGVVTPNGRFDSR